MNRYGFAERLAYSKSHVDDHLRQILEARLPGVNEVEVSMLADDRSGTDYWAVRDLMLPDLSIDVKIRSTDFAAHQVERLRSDDLALETWSVCHTKIGWTRDSLKRTDYVLWFWSDTKRFFIVPFPPLCCLFQRYWEEWVREFKVAQQESDGGAWRSECVYVPRDLVVSKLNQWASGFAR